MPIYEYSCQRCGHKFSHLHKRLGENAPSCPECHSSDVKKLFSTFSAAVATKPSCAHAEACAAAQGGHQCCPGCCHHNH